MSLRPVSHFSLLRVFALALAFPIFSAEAETVVERWVQRTDYLGPYNDIPAGIAVDRSGNVVVTGYTMPYNGDYYTVKYAAATGQRLWEKRYDGPDGFDDQATAVAIDGDGNVIVTGYSFSLHGQAGASDYYTAKYAGADGSLLWERRYDGPSQSYDEAMAVAVDRAGNVIVTGQSYGPPGVGGGPDFYTAKYAAADGAILWEQRYNGPANGGESAVAVVVDAVGNVIVTGSSPGALFCTVKYAGIDGTVLWEQRSANLYGAPSDMTLDSGGNVVVTGFVSNGFNSHDDFYTVMYAGSTGAVVWERRYDGPAHYHDRARKVRVDEGNNVIVTGMSFVAYNNPDHLTVKYDGRNGNTLWERRYENAADAQNDGPALTLDFAGNVVVTGAYDGNGFYTAKYASADGAPMWEKHYDGPGGNLDVPRAIAFDMVSQGVIVTGRADGGYSPIYGYTKNDFATVKYDFDTDQPVLTLPSAITREATSPAGATATFTISATDAFDPAPVVETSHASGSTFPLGVTTVNVTATDESGNDTTGSFTVTVVDTTAPTIAAPVDGFTGLVLFVEQGGTVALPDFVAQAVFADAVGVTEKMQSPLAGTLITEGLTEVTLTARDAAGYATELKLNVSVRVEGQTVLAQSGEEVPNFAGETGLPEGTTWSTFGVPSIVQNGRRAGWLASVRTPAGKTFHGIFDDNQTFSPLLARTGQLVPDRTGNPVRGTIFQSFRNPVFAGDAFAFIAQTQGARAGTGVWLNHSEAYGRFVELAREGTVAPGTRGVTFKAFTSLAMPAEGMTAFTARLNDLPQRDEGLWVWSEDMGLRLALREHPAATPVWIGGATYVRSFQALTPVKGSMGHGRYEQDQPVVAVWLTLTDGRKAIGYVTPEGSLSLSFTTGEVDAKGRTITNLGVPSGTVCLATLALDEDWEITSANRVGVFDVETLQFSARVGEFAPDGSALRFKSFLDPVAGIDAQGRPMHAFIATLNSAAPGITGIWAYDGELALVALQDMEPPGAPGTKWKSFTSLSVLEGRGPIFTATLSSRETKVKPGNDAGVWATNSDGTLQLLFREGDEVAPGKTLGSFDVLEAVAGSPGQRRAWTSGDASARVIYRAFFTDGTSAILTSAVP